MANLEYSTIRAWLDRRDGRVLPNQVCGNSPLYAQEYDFVSSYGEPGYDQPKAGIWIGNWNYLPRWFCDLLERNGYTLEWSDEWHIDYETDKCWRTQPDSYGWTSSCVYSETTGDMITSDDLEHAQFADAFLADITNQPDRAMTRTMHLDLAARGFTLVQEGCEAGWYPGQTDEPQAIMEAILAEKPKAQIVFDVTGVGQFDTRFQVWMKGAA